MKLSQMADAYQLACQRHNLLGMLIDLEEIIEGEPDEDGEVLDPEVEISVHGWRIDVPADRVPDLIELARDAAQLEIAEIERKLAALGVEIDAEVADAELEDA